MTFPTLRLPDQLAGSLAAGHPWVYRDHVAKRPSIPDGAWVRVEADRTAGVGLWAAAGPIAVRVFRRHPAGGPLACTGRQSHTLELSHRSLRSEVGFSPVPILLEERWLVTYSPGSANHDMQTLRGAICG